MHLLRYVVKCTVTDSPFNTQARCSKCPPSASIHFLTCVTRELVNLRSAAALFMLFAALRIRWSSSFLMFNLCPYNTASFNPANVNLIGSYPVIVVANSAHCYDQFISLGIYDSDSAWRPD